MELITRSKPMIEAIDTDILLIERIASGGMAEIFLGKQIGSGTFERNVAIKRVYPHFADKPEFRQMFLREVSLGARLQHPNIVQVIKSVERDKELYMVMEYINGKDLRFLLKRFHDNGRHIPEPVSLYIMSEILTGLDFAHNLQDEGTGESLNTVHRDISPSNILIDFNGSVKIVDFGIAKAADSTSLTKTGSIKGKFEYLPPEVLDGSEPDGRADIFAAGVVFFEMLAGYHLFVGSSPTRTLIKIKEGVVPDLQLTNKKVCEESRFVVNKMLHSNVNERYQTAAAAQKHIRKILSIRYPDFSNSDFKEFVKKELADEIKSENEKLKNMVKSSGYYEVKTGSISLTGITLGFSKKDDKTKLWRNLAYTSVVIASIALLVTAYLNWKVVSQTLIPSTAANPQTIANLIGWFDVESLQTSNPVEPLVWSSTPDTKFKLLQSELMAQPKYVKRAFNNSASALIFDGQNDFMTTEDLPTTFTALKAISVFVIAKAEPQERGYLWSFHPAQRDQDVVRMGLKGSKLEIKYSPTVGSNYVMSPDINVNKINLYSLTLNDNELQVFVNGLQVIKEPAFYQLNLKDVANFNIGEEWDEDKNMPSGVKPTDFFKGMIGDVVVYSRSLPDDERGKVENFLLQKYHISADQ